MKWLPRKQAHYIVMTITTLIMTLRCGFLWWKNDGDGTMRVQCTVIFMRVHMFMCNYMDAKILDDSEKSKLMTAHERKYASYVRTLPSFADWCHYHMFAPFSFMGESIEYGIFDDFINFRGDIKKMRPFANVVPAIRRHLEHLMCCFVFYSLGAMAPLDEMTKPDFLDTQFWHKVIFMVIAANSRIYFLFARFVYHEAALIASGISYRAKTDKNHEEFNSIRSMDLMNFMWG